MRTRRQIEIKCIGFIPGRMVRRGIQGIKVMVFGLNFRTVRQRETQPVKNVHDPVQRLRQHMHGPRGIRPARQSGIEFPGGGSCHGSFPAFFFPSLFQGLAKFVDRFAVGRPIRTGHGLQTIEKFLHLALSAEVAVSPSLLGGGVTGRGEFGERALADPRDLGGGGLGHGRSPRANCGRLGPRRKTPRVR